MSSDVDYYSIMRLIEYAPGSVDPSDLNDPYLQTRLARKVHYHLGLPILRVCKVLEDEGVEILNTENHFVGIRGLPSDLIRKLIITGVWFGRYRSVPGQPVPQPVLQIDLNPIKNTDLSSPQVLVLLSDLHRVALTLYGQPTITLQLRVSPSNALISGIEQNFVKKSMLPTELVDMVGSKLQVWLTEGMRMVTLPSLMLQESSEEKTNEIIKRIRDDFKDAYNLHKRKGFPAAMQEYLDVRDKIWLISRSYRSLYPPPPHGFAEPARGSECHLKCMLSWILFHIATSSKMCSSDYWRLKFAGRCMPLPSYVAKTEWTARIHALAAGVLRYFRDTETDLRATSERHNQLLYAWMLLAVRFHGLVPQPMALAHAMKERRQWDAWHEALLEAEENLKGEIERKYGAEPVIPQALLDDE